MTKVQIEYALTEEITEANMAQISRLHGVYGIYHVKLAPAMDSLRVEYDASRLNRKEVFDVLSRAGIPVKLKSETSV